MIIAVDFDGTCVMHEFPEVGGDVPFAVESLQALTEEGHDLILWTMRGGEFLTPAVKWFEDKGLRLMGVNTNPLQRHWTDSPKAYAEFYVDDCAVGCPLVRGVHARPYVDWTRVMEIIRG